MEALTPASPDSLPPVGELTADEPFQRFPLGAAGEGVARLRVWLTAGAEPGHRAARRAVVRHPCRLGHRREQRTANRLDVPPAEQAIPVAAEVLDQRLASVPAAEPVIKMTERLHRHPEALHISHARPHPPAVPPPAG
jgi:hypothetical protein